MLDFAVGFAAGVLVVGVAYHRLALRPDPPRPKLYPTLSITEDGHLVRSYPFHGSPEDIAEEIARTW